MTAVKDPERVALGRMGALAVHARGRTNVVPARAAWEASLAAEFGITDELDPAEHKRRMAAALRLRMAQLARMRWAKKAATTPEKRRGGQMEETDATRQPQRPAA